MPVSFWIFLIVCFVSFILVIRDHGESWIAFNNATGKDKCRKGSHLFALWFVPVFTLIGTLFLGRESMVSDKKDDDFRRQINSLSNDLATANIKPPKVILIEFIESLNPKIIQDLKNGENVCCEGRLDDDKIKQLQSLAKNPECSQFLTNIEV